MPTNLLDLFMASMFPETSSFLRVTQGELKLSLTGNTFIYSGDYVMHVDTGEGRYSEAHVIFTTAGTYHTEDTDVIIFEAGQETNMQTVKCTAYSPETGLISAPCAGMGIQQTLPAGSIPYYCSGSELQLEVQSTTPALPTLLMFFERKP